MQKYYLHATWGVEATMIVEAESLKDAIAQAHIRPLPKSPKYIAGSFEVDKEKSKDFTDIMSEIETPVRENR